MQQLLRAGSRDVLCGEGDRDGLLVRGEVRQDSEVSSDIKDRCDDSTVQRIDGIQRVRTLLQVDDPNAITPIGKRCPEEAQQRDGERSVAAPLDLLRRAGTHALDEQMVAGAIPQDCRSWPQPSSRIRPEALPKWNARPMGNLVAREPLPSRELAAFVAAVDAGTIGAAADSLSLSQSAVTKRLQSLERRVGHSLLARSHTGVQPTEAGSAFYPDAKAALSSLARAAEILDGERTASERRLSLAASHTIGTFLLPGWLTAFTAADGPAAPHVSVVNSGAVLAAVHNREVDIGFLPDPPALDHLDAIYVGQGRELVVVVGCGHRWARARSVTPSQLTSEPFFTREEGSGTRTASLASLRRLGVELHPDLETSSTEALKRTLRGGGFTIMSSLARPAGSGRQPLSARLHRVCRASAR